NFPKWPYYSPEEIQKVKDILISGRVNYWTGKEGQIFEKEFANFSLSKYAVTLANGSLALSAAYLALDIKNNIELITTPRTFIATSSSAYLLNAKPIFADVDIDSGCITAEFIEPLISKNTKAICVVHLAGWPCDMESICDLAKKYGIYVIEDCSQAHGAQINGKSVGSFGDVSIWSFCQDKIISTGGEGGMLTTNSEEIYEKVWSFRDHGKTIKSMKFKKKSNEFRFVHENFGSNFRMTEVQSALGRIQLRNIFETNKIRAQNAKILIDTLSEVECIRIPIPKEKYNHAWYKFYCYLNFDSLKENWNREKIINEINKLGYPAFSGGCSEIYLENCFLNANLSPTSRLKNAKLLGETSLMFLVHHTISFSEMKEYAETIKRILILSMKD
ncbi:DegT/DnrJ/EryC1/StrS aminotransferase family protein, partial [Prochlorococcus sp. AH-736-J10]|nr:DegT/DnrJ/EryC1/StrS aminotransferase family protein [Prochlorococcus sp. AH-736-J10]